MLVRTSDGQPVRGTDVRVRMKRHEFGFGSAVAADGIFSEAPDSHAYREVIRTWSNNALLENHLTSDIVIADNIVRRGAVRLSSGCMVPQG